MGLKILHTADWHIGKHLMRHDFEADLRYFFQWLMPYIVAEGIDVVLISGDVFDHINPSNTARTLYFEVLKQLIDTKAKIIITGGNHDHVANLRATKELLMLLNIHVIGGAEANIEDEIIEILDSTGKLALVVLAVPFLRDADLRTGQDHTIENRVEMIRKGIVHHYHSLYEICQNRYSQTVPILAMGHHYIQSATTSESEREIQVGNLAGVDFHHFDQLFDYVALGHIHRPQSFGNDRVVYSGSPVAFSFSEYEDKKEVVIIHVDGKKLDVKHQKVPTLHQLRRIKGTFEAIKQKLSDLVNEHDKAILVEVVCSEQNYDPNLLLEWNDFVNNFEADNVRIITSKINFVHQPSTLSHLFEEDKQIDDLSPLEIFEAKMANESIEEGQKTILWNAFNEILDEVENDSE